MHLLPHCFQFVFQELYLLFRRHGSLESPKSA
jgi:hypothetical protein